MPEYRIVLTRSAERELEDLPEAIWFRVKQAIDGLGDNPRPRVVRKLRGHADLWRIRIGDYRVIYRIDDRQQLVDITHVRHRSEAYE